MSTETGSSREDSGKRLKVFLSYSRKDSAFAAELLSGLELLGFDAYLDKEDIAPGEPWEDRLGSLIRQADTVVFIISPNSLASKHCGWEVEETAKSGKRLVPVILTIVPDAQVPERLRRLNYVFFNEGQSFARSLGQLAQALRADAGWIREHSRIGELATRWLEKGKTAALLLRGSDLDDAKKWAVSRPQNAPEISAAQQSFIEASSKAASDELAAKLKLRWRVQAGLLVASAVLAGLAALSFLQWQSAERANALLDATNARLERKLALRAAPHGYAAYDVPAGWFQIATKYASAVAFVESRYKPKQIEASGVLVNARTLNGTWEARPVFVTANYVVSDRETTIARLPSNVRIVMLGPHNEWRTANLDKIVWESPELGISISSIRDALPADVTAMDVSNGKPEALADLQDYSWNAIDDLFDDRGMLKNTGNLRPIVFIGNPAGRPEVAISISHLLGTLRNAPAGSDATTNSVTSGSVGLNYVPDLLYTHGTLPGGGGSPVFDAATGDLIGIHFLGRPCPVVMAQNWEKCSGGGTSMTRLLAAVRSQ